MSTSRSVGARGRPNHSSLAISAAISVLLGALSGPTVRAAPKENGSYALGEIVVTGQRPGVAAIETVHTVTAAEIRRQGAQTLSEALVLVPGVSVRTGADGTPRIDIRGLRTRNIELLINGVPVHSTLDGQFDPRLIPADDIARIRIVTGASSELYGDGGMAAVIDVITRKGHGSARGGVAAEIGQDGYDHEAVHYSAGTQKASVFISAQRRQRDSWRLSRNFTSTSLQPTRSRVNSAERFNNFYGNVTYTPSDSWHLGWTYTHADGAYGIPPGTLSTSGDPFATKPKYERISGLRGNNLQMVADFTPRGPWSLRSWVYINKRREDDRRYDDANFDSFLKKGSFDAHDQMKTTGGHAQIEHSTAYKGRLSLGLDSRRETWNQTGTINKTGGSAGFQPLDESQDVRIDTVALQYSFEPIARTGLVFGAGRHMQHLTGRTQSANSFIAGVYRDIGKATRVHVSVAKKIRMPSIQQLYDVTSGNPELKAESSRTYEVGLQTRLTPVASVHATAYTMNVHNFIEKDIFTNFYANNDHYRFRGIELGAVWRAQPHWRFRTTYTYLQSKDESPGSSKTELQYRPQYTFGLSASYQPKRGWFGTLTGLAVGKRYFYSRTTPVQKASLAPYFNLYGILGYRFGSPFRGTSVYVKVSNLTDQNYDQSYGFPQPGRTVYAGVRMRI